MKVRSSTLMLCLTNATLLTVLVWMAYAPVQVHWLSADTPPPTTAHEPVESHAILAQAQRSMTWTQPIFSPDRQPDPDREVVTANPLSNLTLTGIVQDGESQWVYLSEPGQPAARLAKGDTLDNGWTLDHLNAHTATFIRQGQTQTLSLPLLRLPPPSEAPTLTLPRTTTP